jgi:uncharacterized repeat protein (TIGR01451 family)
MKKSLTLLAFLLFFKFVDAQSLQVTLNVLNQPCTNNGEVEINATGGTPPYIYQFQTWPGVSGANPILTNNIISGLPPCSMYVIVTDAAGAIAYTNTTVLVSPIQTNIASTPAICPNLGSIQITNVGNGPFTDELFLNGVLLATGSPFTNLQPGIYTTKTTDANGCFTQNDSVYVENLSGINVNIASSNVTCQGGTLTATIVGGLAPYTYSWSSGNSTNNVVNGPLGTYTVNVTDAQGCSQFGYGYLSSPVYIYDNAVVSPTTCPNSTGTVQLFPTGGTAPYTCNWSNGYTGNQMSNLNTGYYDGTIIDAAGCTKLISVSVGSISPIGAQVVTTNSNCLSPTGSAQLTINGGMSPYNIQWLINPPQSGTNIQNVLPGTYPFVITDANGCVQNGIANVGVNDPINIYPISTSNICGQNNGTITSNAWGNSLTYLWSNGSTAANITNLSGGSYSCIITNASGCTKSFGEYISTLSPFSISSNVTPASCIFTADGQITLNISGGTPPYNISWNTGATGATINSLVKGDYYATISDANGCNYSYHFSVGYLSTSPCACTLSGKVYFDRNNSCSYDSLDIALSNVNVKLSSGASVSYSITNAAGNYSFFVPSGSYTIEQLPYQHYAAGACSSNPITINANGGSNCSIINNFADTALIIQDLSTNYINLEPAVVGYGYKQRVIVKNNGTTNANNAKVNIKGSNYTALDFSSFAGSNVAGTSNWNFTGLPVLDPIETFTFDMHYTVLPTTPTNTLMLYTDTVQKNSQPWLQDETPWNNIKNLETYTVASLDPNYKEVNPKGVGSNGDINYTDSILTYTVHFENTGNYFAYNIEIVDSISTNLNLNSFEMIYGSHPYVATIDENGVLHIKFNNIMLAYNTGWNTGFAVYSIKLKSNLVLGTQIKNTAYIYFDFNEAVITNTTVNTLSVNVGLEEFNNGDYNLFPNPASNLITITNKINTLKGTINIYDIMGKLWLSKTISQPVNKVEIDNLDELTNGLYFVNISNDSGEVKTIKFVKSE